MTDCYYEKKDWRQCKKEVSPVVLILPVQSWPGLTIDCSAQPKMEVFRECWKKHHNDERTSMKDA